MPEARGSGHVAIIVLLKFGGKLDMDTIRVSDTQEKIVTGAVATGAPYDGGMMAAEMVGPG